MFVNAAVGLPVRKKVLAIPATAVLYAPYGDSVFVVGTTRNGKREARCCASSSCAWARSAATSSPSPAGLKEGETIVSTGVFKLRNGQAALIDNKLAPTFQQSHPRRRTTDR